MKTKNHRRLWLRFDRVLSNNLWKQLAVLAVVLVIAFGISFLLLSFSGADWLRFCGEKEMSPWLLPIYLLIDTNALNNLYFRGNVEGWMLIASSLTYLFGAFIFNGVIIGIITNSIDRRVRNHREGHIHYLKSGHYIIMGYDEMVSSFIAHIFEKDKDAYVLILSSAETVAIREKLCKSFSESQMKHIIINYGHRTSAEAYRDIRLESAEQIYIVGNHSKPAHDAINVECVDSICRYLNQPEIKDRPSRIVCVFKDLDTYAAFKTSEIFKAVGELQIEFIPYNFYTGWAKQVFVKRFYKDFDNPGVIYHYPAVFGNGIAPSDDKRVHLVFVGTTNFAVAFAMEAAHVLHFPNFNHDPHLRTRITFIDINADKEKDEFITRNRHFFEIQPYIYRDLSRDPKEVSEDTGTENICFAESEDNFLDVEFEFIKGDVFSRKVQREISKWAKGGEYLSIFLALADQRQNFVMGMNMPDEVYDNEIPVFIRQDRSDNFVTNLRNADRKNEAEKLTYSTVENGALKQQRRDARYANIYPFGMNETAYSADDHSLRRAKLINYLYETANYETYKFQGILALEAIPEEQIWQEADRAWRKLSVALKWSNLYNAYAMRTKLASLRAMRGLALDDNRHDYDAPTDEEVKEMAMVEHNRWNVEKLLMGYRKARKEEDKYAHGEFADSLKKNKNLFIHHDIRPYDELNVIDELDKEFTRYLPWIMRMTEKD